VLARMTAAECAIISLTVTEGGYFIEDASGRFLEEHQDVRHDLENGSAPRTWLGYVAEAAARRMQLGRGPFTLLSCDNLQGNGEVARKALLAFAAARSGVLEHWIEENVAFPCSMVDRITPRTTDKNRMTIAEKFGVKDAVAVVCETFRQWVLEDSFAAVRPAFERAGAQMTADVAPYEKMKMRLLNGGHTTLGYFADLLGLDFIRDAAADARSDLAIGSGGALGTGGTTVGSGGSGSAGTGGILADASRDGSGDARNNLQPDVSRDGYSKPIAVPDGGTCPYTGHVSYTFTKSGDATVDKLITAAMDQAVSYYNCYTNITKADTVVYDPSVATADGNSNGTIHFGSDTSYMILRVAMHEISHTVGIGQAANWLSFVAKPDGGSSGPWTGANGIAQRQALLPDVWQQQGQEVLTADTQHFWPYGLNVASDYQSEADLLGHCAMVMALRKDMGM